MTKVCTKVTTIVFALVLFSCALDPAANAGQVIDRIVATVNGHIILQSDWNDALRYEALLSARTVDQFSDEDRRAVLDRLIDQELLAEQMKSALFRHASLAESARWLLETLGYENVKVVTGNGWQGCPEAAPYNAIVVSAAAPEMPRALVAQLAEGGRMIIPVGGGDSQQLQLMRKQNGQVTIELHEMCRFVPLVPSEPGTSP